jgi:hypothetical protein
MNALSLSHLQLSTGVDSYPYPIEKLHQKPWESFTRQNGYADLASKLMVKVFTDEKNAETLWNSFSSNSTVFDLWEIRKAFAEGFGADKPYFITLYEKDSVGAHILGVLPLSFDEEEKLYKWYGCSWPEDNTFFVKDPELIPLLLMCAPRPISLQEIKGLPEYKFLETFYGYKVEDEPKYVLPLTRFQNVDQYIQSLRKKKRHNIKRDCKKITRLNPRLFYGNEEHIENMFRLNRKRFSKPGVSADDISRFDLPYYRKVFRLLAKLACPAHQVFVTTALDTGIEAVEFGFMYNKSCYAFNAGANIESYSGLGTFSNIMLIDYAIKQGCSEVDFLYGDYNWKKSWEFATRQPYEFDLK